MHHRSVSTSLDSGRALSFPENRFYFQHLQDRFLCRLCLDAEWGVSRHAGKAKFGVMDVAYLEDPYIEPR